MKSKFCLILILVTTFALSATAQTSKHKSSKPKAAAPTIAPAPEAEAEEKLPPDRISIAELKRKLDAKQPVLIIDNRTGSSWLGSLVKIKGALHIPLSDLEGRVDELPRDVEIITYCTCPDEATSGGAVWRLRENDFMSVRALVGGFDAWEKAGYPVEPKNTPSPMEKRLKRK